MARLGIDSLVFGTEEVLDYQKIADLYTEKGAEMEQFVENLSDSLSYPQKTQAMWKEFAGLDFSGNTPNHVLALAYAKAVAGRNIKLYPIQRQGAGYHSVDKDVDFASATALRQHQNDKDFLERFMPSVALFEQASKVSWDGLFSISPLPNLVKSRPNHHLSGQSRNGSAHQRCYQDSPVCGRIGRGGCYQTLHKSACQTPLDLYLSAGKRK